MYSTRGIGDILHWSTPNLAASKSGEFSQTFKAALKRPDKNDDEGRF